MRLDAGHEISIGRSRSSTLRIDHPQVSGIHAVIRLREGRVSVKDLSTNGTFVDGLELGRNQVVEDVPHGSVISLVLATLAERDAEGKDAVLPFLTVERMPAASKPLDADTDAAASTSRLQPQPQPQPQPDLDSRDRQPALPRSPSSPPPACMPESSGMVVVGHSPSPLGSRPAAAPPSTADDAVVPQQPAADSAPTPPVAPAPAPAAAAAAAAVAAAAPTPSAPAAPTPPAVEGGVATAADLAPPLAPPRLPARKAGQADALPSSTVEGFQAAASPRPGKRKLLPSLAREMAEMVPSWREMLPAVPSADSPAPGGAAQFVTPPDGEHGPSPRDSRSSNMRSRLRDWSEPSSEASLCSDAEPFPLQRNLQRSLQRKGTPAEEAHAEAEEAGGASRRHDGEAEGSGGVLPDGRRVSRLWRGDAQWLGHWRAASSGEAEEQTAESSSAASLASAPSLVADPSLEPVPVALVPSPTEAGAGAGAEAEEGAERDGEEEERGAEGGAVATETDTARESSASRPRMVTGANLLALVTDGTATHSRGSASRSLDAIVNLGVGDEVD